MAGPGRIYHATAVKRSVIVYGVSGGVLITALKLVEYRLLVVEHSIELYGGFIAAGFAALGVWLGITLTRRHEPVMVQTSPAAASSAGAPPPPIVDAMKVKSLRITPRELEVLQLMARGLTTREMADSLCVSENTAKTHAGRLLDKLGVNRRIKAVEAGRSLGLIP